MRHVSCALALVTPFALGACATYSSVRSAAPPPGIGVHTQVALASNPGDEAGWFWSYDCAVRCGRPIAGAELTTTYGLRGPDSTAARATLGVGITGLSPAVEAYYRLGRSTARPYGVGARVAILSRWVTYNVFGRADFAMGRSARLLWNPGLVLHTGTSPNGMNDGSFLGLVQAVGVESGDGPWRIRPSVAYVLGRAERRSDRERLGPVTRGFATVSFGIGYEPARKARR